MARVSTSGIENFEEKLQRIQGDKWKAVQAIMKAGGDVLIEAWQGSIRSHHHISRKAEGKHMVDAVAMTDIKVTGSGFSAEVYPQGMAGHRITQAQKAFILDRGRQPTSRGTKAIKGDHFVRDAEKAAKPKVIEAMQKALDEFIGKD